ncbi:ring-cleaving dioxygenase, partial [Bacillus spizizenii]|nr:ring-cleaving dioxygenase [Bacillus spizizenii]
SGQGTVGKGQAGRVYFSVPTGSLTFWKERLEKNGLNLEENTLFGEKGLIFDDTEDLPLAIMEEAKIGNSEKSEWTPDGIS